MDFEFNVLIYKMIFFFLLFIQNLLYLEHYHHIFNTQVFKILFMNFQLSFFNINLLMENLQVLFLIFQD